LEKNFLFEKWKVIQDGIYKIITEVKKILLF